jgi:hypothetical protein
MKRKSAKLKVTTMPDFFLSLERAIYESPKPRTWLRQPSLSRSVRLIGPPNRRQILFHGAKSEGPMPVRDCKEGATHRAPRHSAHAV